MGERFVPLSLEKLDRLQMLILNEARFLEGRTDGTPEYVLNALFEPLFDSTTLEQLEHSSQAILDQLNQLTKERRRPKLKSRHSIA
jgi:hypothetical protein